MSAAGVPFPAELLRSLRQAKRIAVLTGAGISAESGVPTFRDAQTGLWAQYDPQELATPRRSCAIRNWCGNGMPGGGSSSPASRPIRGTWPWPNWNNAYRCSPSSPKTSTACTKKRAAATSSNYTAISPGSSASVTNGSWTSGPRRARCRRAAPIAGGMLRPDVVWFGEMLPAGALHEALVSARGADLFLTIGTSSIVQPAASLPVEAALNGATVVEINPDQTAISGYMTHILRGPSGKILPELLAAAWPAGA